MSWALGKLRPLQAIKDALWGFATLNYLPSTTFLDAAAAHCIDRLSGFNPQNIANVAWAYAKFGHNPPNLLHAFANEVSHMPQAAELPGVQAPRS